MENELLGGGRAQNRVRIRRRLRDIESGDVDVYPKRRRLAKAQAVESQGGAGDGRLFGETYALAFFTVGCPDTTQRADAADQKKQYAVISRGRIPLLFPEKTK